ncbi:MAG TPA: hypothetical protein PKK61_00825 [Defluviitaleaceae bacterium]|jgi:hypothetical protein|nr:hypothetical protein [Candidatus Epulonipiscium sp.]HOA79595.1 hypothetical protein [Defluviitaleaceae bacterium]
MAKKKNAIQDNQELVYVNRSSKSSLGSFFLGLILLCAGIYLIFQNTIISSNFSLEKVIGFTPSFGLVLLPLIIGIVVLFFNSKSWVGWLFIVFGMLIILLGILMGLKIRFMPVTLYEAILMYGMTAAGLGLVLRGLLGK